MLKCHQYPGIVPQYITLTFLSPSFVICRQGYRKQDAYIVTQIPFENNRHQFWKMIESTQANLIVLLNEANNEEQVVSVTSAAAG